MLPAYYVCCIDSYAFKTSFIMEANTMNPDQRSRLKWVHIVIEATKVHQQIKNQPIFELLHDISKNVVCETREGSDQPAHMHSLIRAFASRLIIL